MHIINMKMSKRASIFQGFGVKSLLRGRKQLLLYRLQKHNQYLSKDCTWL